MVSIIIVSYNTKELLGRCLNSVYSNLTGVSFEVLVVDNGSSDGSVEMVRKSFKNTQTIENKQNFGFAKGVNIGAKHAKGKYLLFLNSDTQIQDNKIKDIVDILEKEKNIGVVGGKVQNEDGTFQKSFGSFNIFSLLSRDNFVKKRSFNEVIKVDWVNGAFMFVRKDLFDNLMGFDENFFMYVEDVELCYRVKKAGYSVYFYPFASTYHLGQGSSNREFAITSIYKGILYFYKKHKSYLQYVLIKELLMLKAFLAMMIGVLTGNSSLFKTYKKAIKYTL